MNVIVVLAVALLSTLSLAPGAGRQKTSAAPRAGIAFRGGVTPIDLPALAANSQFIWKGEITAASAPQAVTVQYGAATLQAEVQTLTFRVDRAFKGTPPGSGLADFDLYLPSGPGPLWGRIGGPFTPGWYGIVLLTTQDAQLVPTDPVYPGVQASPLVAPATGAQDAMSIIEGELINTLRDTQHARVQAATDLLVSLHDQVNVASQFGPPEGVVLLDREGLIGALRLTADSADPILSGTGLAGLLRLGDLSHLQEAVSYVDRYGPPPG